MSKGAQLAQDLGYYTGSEHWYRVGIAPRVTYTDGVKYFAETAQAWWLIDIWATELPQHLKREGFLAMVARVNDNKADLSATDGNNKTVWQRQISYTDCPEGEWKFYFGHGGPQGTDVIMLRSEY